MASHFYIKKNDGEVLALTVTTSLSVEDTASVTSHPVESGKNVADNIIVNNKRVSFSGWITEIRSSSTTHSVKDYIEKIERMQRNRETFTLYYDSRLTQLDNVVLVSFKRDRNTDTGDAYSVSLDFEQIRISARAALTEIPEGVTDSTQPETGGAGSTTKQVPTSLLVNVKDYLTGLNQQIGVGGTP